MGVAIELLVAAAADRCCAPFYASGPLPPTPATMSTRASAQHATGRSPTTTRRTGMGRSFFRPTPSNTLEAYTGPRGEHDFYHALSDTHFSMILRDGQYYQRRWQIGFGGKETNVEELRIDYVMGSGNHARSYLHRTPRGTLIELPLGWYSERTTGMGAPARATGPCPRAPIPTIRGPGASSPTSACSAITAFRRFPPGNEAPGSDPVFTGDLRKASTASAVTDPAATTFEPSRTRQHSRQTFARASSIQPA